MSESGITSRFEQRRRCFESQEPEAGRAPRGYCNSPGMLVAWIKVVAREEMRSGEIWGVVWNLPYGICWLIDSLNKYLLGANYILTAVLRIGAKSIYTYIYMYIYIYLFVAALDICCCAWAFSSCDVQASPFGAFSCGAQAPGRDDFRSCGMRA